MIPVQIRKELANMPLATIPINVKKDDNTTKVITSRMDPNITIVWELLIAYPKCHPSRRTLPMPMGMST